jgi:hypothetical protein
MSQTAEAVRECKPHMRPVRVRLTQPCNGQAAGFVIGPIPLHVAELYANRGAGVILEDEEAPTLAKRIWNAPRNKSFAGA